MQRREFLAFSLALAAGEGSARAEPRPPVVGFINDTGVTGGAPIISILRGLGRQGFISNQTFLMMQRPLEKYDDAASAAAELVKRGVDALVALESANTALAVRDTAKNLPVVFAGAYDAQALGLVENLDRPGGKITGVMFSAPAVVEKRAALAAALAGPGGKIGLLVNPANKASAAQRAAYGAAVKSLVVFEAGSLAEIDAAFARAAGVGAMIIADDPWISRNADATIAAAARARIAALHATRDEVAAGGLVCHGDVRTDQLFKLGETVGRVLKGEKPAAIAVSRADKFATFVNAKTAATLGFDVVNPAFAGADVVR